mgnify:CR=1 FL=1
MPRIKKQASLIHRLARSYEKDIKEMIRKEREQVAEERKKIEIAVKARVSMLEGREREKLFKEIECRVKNSKATKLDPKTCQVINDDVKAPD